MQVATLDSHRQTIDAAALATPGIDTFCASSAWLQSAVDAFHPDSTLHILQRDRTVTVFARHGLDDGRRFCLTSPEAVWGLASPILGERADTEAPDLVREALRSCGPVDGVLLPGLPSNSAWSQVLRRGLSPLGVVFPGPSVGRRVVSMEGGRESFLRGRSRRFRSGLRRSGRLAQEAGIRFRRFAPVPPEAASELGHTVLDIERRSWKGLSGQGAEAGPMRTFTEGLIMRTASMGTLYGIVATIRDTPVGYLYGALFGGDFRGIQMSFDEGLRRIGLGNLMQLEMLELLWPLGVRTYDLGMDMPYKAAWTDDLLVTESIYLVPFHRARSPRMM